MKMKIIPLAFLSSIWSSYGQVGIGTLSPNVSAQLEISSQNKVLLIPRVSLQSNEDMSTMTNGNVNSLLVYNTTNNDTITEGFYYWLNNRWMKLISSADFETYV